ncbi:MAG: DUF5050 domain-containing protein [Lachnospiraceae bacterium]|nr:DUF5050 domain-containing protein [Lachnospiraceae bacterium]
MTTKQKNILIISITVVIFIILVVCVVITSHVALNDEATVGNTAGNLNNNGYFCEHDGRVYFANAYDNYSLYSMNPDETDVKKLRGGSSSHICAGGKYLYYAVENQSGGSDLGSVRGAYGIYRCQLNGKNATGMDRCHVDTMQLCGNYLYYSKLDPKSSMSLEKIKIDKKDKATVSPDAIINPASYVNGAIYYCGTGQGQEHYLYALNTANDTSSVVWQGNLWNPIYQNGYVYFMDIGNNYRLCRYSMNAGVVEVLTNERLDLFNVYGDYIYYQTNSKTEPALKRISIGGGAPEIVREGIYQNINITSEYVYFNAFGESTPVYKTSTYGPVNVNTFDAGMQAALQETK